MTAVFQRFEDSVAEVSRALGIRLALERSSGSEHFDYSIRVGDIQEGKGFKLQVRHGFLQWTFDLIAEDYSAGFLRLMSERFMERRFQFTQLVSFANQQSNRFSMEPEPATADLVIEEPWSNFSIHAVVEYGGRENPFDKAFSSILSLCSIPLSLLEESSEWTTAEDAGEVEGALSIRKSRSYERSRYNRAICLSHYGFTCRGCGVQMSDVYGPLSREVIQVHHLEPVSLMQEPRSLNPIRDLVPLCPNCHSVAHTASPPLGVTQLRERTGFAIDDWFR